MAVGQTKDGRWRCYYRDHRGKSVDEYFGRGLDAKEAAETRDLEIKLAKKKARSDHNTGNAPLYHELCQDYINVRHVELAASTRDDILRTVALYALPVLENKPIDQITMADWTAIEKRMLDRGSCGPRSINKYFQYLSKILDWACERYAEVLPDNPWRKRKPLRIQKKFRVELMTLDEFGRIMAAADVHLRWALEVELNVGCRPGKTELFRLKWTDVDWDTGAVKIYPTKTDSYHTQYVSPEFLDKMRARRAEVDAYLKKKAEKGIDLQKEGYTNDYVITYHGKPVKQMARAFAAAKKTAGITRRIRLYDFRHFYITHALAGGADLLNLAHRVGHKTPNMIVNVYSHLVDELKNQTAFPVPAIPQAKDMPAFVGQNVGQNKKAVPERTANILEFKKNNGRGGRI